LVRKELNRSKFDIMREMLQFISEEGSACKTHILYATNLNTHSLEKFLDKLIKINAIKIEHVDGKPYYQITLRGARLLKLFNKIQKMIKAGEHNKRILSKKKNHDLTWMKKSGLVGCRVVKGRSGFIHRYENVIGNTLVIEHIVDEPFDEEDLLIS